MNSLFFKVLVRFHDLLPCYPFPTIKFNTPLGFSFESQWVKSRKYTPKMNIPFYLIEPTPHRSIQDVPQRILCVLCPSRLGKCVFRVDIVHSFYKIHTKCRQHSPCREIQLDLFVDNDRLVHSDRCSVPKLAVWIQISLSLFCLSSLISCYPPHSRHCTCSEHKRQIKGRHMAALPCYTNLLYLNQVTQSVVYSTG